MDCINSLFLFLFVFFISHYFSAFTAFSQPLLTGYVTVMYQVPHIIIYFFAQSNKLLSTHLRMSLVLLFSENHRGANLSLLRPFRKLLLPQSVGSNQVYLRAVPYQLTALPRGAFSARYQGRITADTKFIA